LDRPNKTTFQILTALLVGLAVVGLDFAARQVYKKFRKRPVRAVAEHREPNPFYHHGLRANASVMDTFGDRQYPFLSNSLGMRDGSVREVSLDKKGPRILLIGDSFTEGVGLPWEKTFAGILAARLSADGIEVLNSGVNSYCPILFKGRLRYLFDQKGLEVDRVVALVDISDIMQELTYQETPGGEIRPRSLLSEAEAKELSDYVAMEDWSRTYLEDQFVLLGALARNLRLWCRDHVSPSGVRRQDELPLWAFHWPEYQGPYESKIEEGLDLAQRHMTEIAEDLRRRKIALTVMIYPWPQQLPHLSRPSRAETVWQKWAANHGVDFINLFRDFARMDSPDEILKKYYLQNDWHWNDRGNAVVADLLLHSYRALVLPPTQASSHGVRAVP
jgi:hypothetical protein